MSLLPRHRYMISRMSEAFCFSESEIERLVLVPEVLEEINNFLSPEGPSKILITLEEVEQIENAPLSPSKNISSNISIQDSYSSEPSTPRDDATVNSALTSNIPQFISHRLRIFTDDLNYIPNTTVYFMKNDKISTLSSETSSLISSSSKDAKDSKPVIDLNKSCDNYLTFGILHAPLESLEALVRLIYKPFVNQLSEDMKGEADATQLEEFYLSLDNFIKNIQESIKNISCGLELRKPDEKVENLNKNEVTDLSLVVHCVNLLQEWCVKIEKYLDDSDRSKWENVNSGPDTELIYWRNRTQR